MTIAKPFLTLCFFFHAAAIAQQLPSPDTTIHHLQTLVVTATRTPKPSDDVPVTIISHSDIQTANTYNVQELLLNELPGLELTLSMNQQESFRLHGFGGASLLFLVDGERLAGETLDNIDYHRLSVNTLGHVEILNGAASALYGSNAVGAVVNLVSDTPTTPFSLSAGTRFGTYGEQRHHASIALARNRLSSTTHLQYTSRHQVDLPSPGDYQTLFGQHSLNASQRLSYHPLQWLDVSARAAYFFRERESDETLHDRYRDFSAGLSANARIGTNTTLSATYAFDQYDKSRLTLGDNLDVRTYSNVQHTARLLFSTFSPPHSTFTAGAELLRDFLMSYQFAPDSRHRQYTASAFVQWDWQPTERVNLVGALRYDHFTASATGRITPRLTASLQIGDNVTLRATLSDGFRAPTLKEMFMNFDMAGLFTVYGNDTLHPEHSHNATLAAEYRHGNTRLTSSLFYHRVYDRISTFWDHTLGGMRYANEQPVDIAGTDLALSTRWTCGLGLRIGYTFTHETSHTSAPLSPSTRPHSATLRVDYSRKWKGGTTALAIHLRALSAVKCDEYVSYLDLSTTTTRTHPSYALLRLTALHKFNRFATLSLSVDNLLDYVPDYYYNNAPATPGRTFSIGLDIDM